MTMELDMIKACPCCGSPAEARRLGDFLVHHWIECTGCGIRTDWEFCLRDALLKWNTRTHAPGI